MLTENEILSALDNANDGWYRQFIDLDDGYSFLIDSRLNIFRDEGKHWAIAAERLGYNPRAGTIQLVIFYYGNCLINLESYNEHHTNSYLIEPIERDNFFASDPEGVLRNDAEFWLVRGEKLYLNHNRQDYIKEGIIPDLSEDHNFRIEEVARLLITKESDVFRATDKELYKSIPKNLKKILVLNEWHYRSFYLTHENNFSEQDIQSMFNQSAKPAGLDFDTFRNSVITQEIKNKEFNQNALNNNAPSKYETWQQIAKVIATGETKHYKPTLKPNSHWKFHPKSGGL